jgi:hypothetical protein
MSKERRRPTSLLARMKGETREEIRNSIVYGTLAWRVVCLRRLLGDETVRLRGDRRGRLRYYTYENHGSQNRLSGISQNEPYQNAPRLAVNARRIALTRLPMSGGAAGRRIRPESELASLYFLMAKMAARPRDRDARAQGRVQRAVRANQLNPSQKHPPRFCNLLLMILSLMLGWNLEQPSNDGVSGCSQLMQPVRARSLAGRR